jgi:hypothetical protein
VFSVVSVVSVVSMEAEAQHDELGDIVDTTGFDGSRTRSVDRAACRRDHPLHRAATRPPVRAHRTGGDAQGREFEVVNQIADFARFPPATRYIFEPPLRARPASSYGVRISSRAETREGVAGSDDD